jgi:hypothetical protein
MRNRAHAPVPVLPSAITDRAVRGRVFTPASEVNVVETTTTIDATVPKVVTEPPLPPSTGARPATPEAEASSSAPGPSHLTAGHTHMSSPSIDSGVNAQHSAAYGSNRRRLTPQQLRQERARFNSGSTWTEAKLRTVQECNPFAQFADPSPTETRESESKPGRFRRGLKAIYDMLPHSLFGVGFGNAGIDGEVGIKEEEGGSFSNAPGAFPVTVPHVMPQPTIHVDFEPPSSFFEEFMPLTVFPTDEPRPPRTARDNVYALASPFVAIYPYMDVGVAEDGDEAVESTVDTINGNGTGDSNNGLTFKHFARPSKHFFHTEEQRSNWYRSSQWHTNRRYWLFRNEMAERGMSLPEDKPDFIAMRRWEIEVEKAEVEKAEAARRRYIELRDNPELLRAFEGKVEDGWGWGRVDKRSSKKSGKAYTTGNAWRKNVSAVVLERWENVRQAEQENFFAKNRQVEPERRADDIFACIGVRKHVKEALMAASSAEGARQPSDGPVFAGSWSIGRMHRAGKMERQPTTEKRYHPYQSTPSPPCQHHSRSQLDTTLEKSNNLIPAPLVPSTSGSPTTAEAGPPCEEHRTHWSELSRWQPPSPPKERGSIWHQHMLECIEYYDATWDLISASVPEPTDAYEPFTRHQLIPRTIDDGLIFATVPWPVFVAPKTSEDITLDSVRNFFAYALASFVVEESTDGSDGAQIEGYTSVGKLALAESAKWEKGNVEMYVLPRVRQFVECAIVKCGCAVVYDLLIELAKEEGLVPEPEPEYDSDSDEEQPEGYQWEWERGQSLDEMDASIDQSMNEGDDDGDYEPFIAEDQEPESDSEMGDQEREAAMGESASFTYDEEMSYELDELEAERIEAEEERRGRRRSIRPLRLS